MNSNEVRRKFLEFFKERGHAIVPSSSLIPDDPSVLLTTAGMQQFKPYYVGEKDPMKDFGSRNTASVQKSFRTSDIDEVGDSTHLTFFEMLGNFSFGGYFKKEAISYAHEFIAKELGLPISYVTVFRGSDAVPKDEESRAIWNSLGVTDIREEGMDDVFWGPTGGSGPCGPTTEIYCRNEEGKDVEVWNIVFNQYFYPGSREELLSGLPGKELQPLDVPGVDTGMGFERLVSILQRKSTIFETDLFAPLLAVLPSGLDERSRRIMADHGRASAFLISDGVRPSNKGAGYVLRRLLRRMIVFKTGIETKLLAAAVEAYKEAYPSLDRPLVSDVFQEENEKFSRTLNQGLRELEKLDRVDAASAFRLYETFGIPYEVIKEYQGGDRSRDLRREDFDAELAKHQDLSRTASAGMFRGGLADHSERTVRLHTAHHLLLRALQIVLGSQVKQRGSNINQERLRIDFSYDGKMT
jgi:alanyl-tRNA synthetase